MQGEILGNWVHSAIAGRGATLREIIAYVDYRNHAIITYDELIHALSQLAMKHSLERRGQLLVIDQDPTRPMLNDMLFSPEEFRAAVNEYLANS